MTEEQSNLLNAARNLINFVKSKYPGQDLYCPYMRALEKACKIVEENKREAV